MQGKSALPSRPAVGPRAPGAPIYSLILANKVKYPKDFPVRLVPTDRTRDPCLRAAALLFMFTCMFRVSAPLLCCSHMHACSCSVSPRRCSACHVMFMYVFMFRVRSSMRAARRQRSAHQAARDQPIAPPRLPQARPTRHLRPSVLREGALPRPFTPRLHTPPSAPHPPLLTPSLSTNTIHRGSHYLFTPL